jgi:prepilin-type N-terminal cleavage/methylation domain-containing protein
VRVNGGIDEGRPAIRGEHAAADHLPIQRPGRRDGGFTLIELMIVILIVGILASLATPHFRDYLLLGRLSAARPVLMEIAAKQRMRFKEQGGYYEPGSSHKEQDIVDNLGVPLKEYGDFCFVFVCTTCNASTFAATAEAGDPAIEFEVWAILRQDDENSIKGIDNVNCKVADDKQPGTGWVADENGGETGQAGSVVVYRHPPPPNGRDAATANGADGIDFDWVEGLSTSHAMLYDN